ncbi:hypothetical protein lacNasYZ03_08900 [Lactobacillus nasalidis]|uniref:YcxB-like protein domain-containing protein n=1 Tax=Lactobacillus nasalidis TaxID=2797258 RepID=A0ABQ3W407_9LACO|nr:YcxB family protein [Lactobacillus nasalidis]GHV97951.1 hypothetical protein lacNasYZ01_11330 [Lactobacillus nasalidis]GHV99888.1 hypothetical protein lacNasYZ02_13180 [Lactobacillus nasalidis]GHW01203.1 hypothetical protein lacNasYZ03_08900 [Lactobacillus nasalidis]
MAQALYVSELRMDLAEYTRMAMKVTEKSRRRIIMIAETIWILAGIAAFLFRQYDLTVLLAVVIAFYPAAIVYLYKRRLKKIYESMPAIKDDYIRYEFYPDHFLVLTNRGDGDYRYEQIVQYLEGQEEIVLLADQNQGMLLLKKNCSPELISFLREKYQQ